ncbi:MAG: hypothetical protein HYW88_01230 [Candidatus Sungbacteria bacterium]|nr:hypothetical protein [Candidatus Sungbacteria bacterium]
MPKNISAKNRFIIIISILVVGSLLMLYLFLNYLFPRILAEVESLEEMKVKIATLEARQSRLKNIEESFQGSKDDIERIEGLLVDRSDPLKFFESLYSIASSSNVLITLQFSSVGIPPEKLKDDKPQFGVSMRIAADGQTKNILAFLGLLETLPYELTVDDISLLSAGGATLRAELAITALSIH